MASEDFLRNLSDGFQLKFFGFSLSLFYMARQGLWQPLGGV